MVAKRGVEIILLGADFVYSISVLLLKTINTVGELVQVSAYKLKTATLKISNTRK